MVTVLVILSTWVLLNILFVLIVVPPRKPRRRPNTSAATLSPAPIDRKSDRFEQDEPMLLRHVLVSVAMGVFFVLVPPLMTLRDLIARLFKRPPGDGADQG